jgi:hypothetical protein
MKEEGKHAALTAYPLSLAARLSLQICSSQGIRLKIIEF